MCVKGHHQENEKVTHKMGKKYLKTKYLQRDLHPKYVKDILNIKRTIKKQVIQLKNGLRIWGAIFSRENIQMANKHMKRGNSKPWETILLAPRWGKQEQQITSYQGCREMGTLTHCWWDCKVSQLLWKRFGNSSMHLTQSYHMT